MTTTTAAPRARAAGSRRAIAVSAAIAAVLLTALLPVVVGLAFIISAATGRPALATLASRWRALDPPVEHGRRALRSATLVNGVGLLLIGAGQGIGEIAGVLSISSRGGLAMRTGLALVFMLVLATGSACYLRRAQGAAHSSPTTGGCLHVLTAPGAARGTSTNPREPRVQAGTASPCSSSPP